MFRVPAVFRRPFPPFAPSIAAVLAAVILSAPAAEAQTAFTYQGQLKSSGNPYSGTADLRFTLYDAPAGGSVIGAAIDAINLTVTNGVVTTELDFGALVFDGGARWLEIAVVTPSAGGAGSYTALAPRQPITPAPYAMHAAIAGLVPDTALTGDYSNPLSMTNASNVFAGDGSGLVGLNASNITAGQLGSDQLGGAYGNAVNFTSAGNTFAGDGSGLVNLDWNNLVSVPPGFADGIDNTGDSFWGGVSPGNIFYTGGNVGIGTNNPAVRFVVNDGEVRLPGGTNPSNLITHFNYAGDGRNYIRGTTILADSGGDVGIGTSTPNGRLNVVGGPTWTSNGWAKALNIPTVGAIELGSGGTTKYGIGSSLNGLYFFTTTTENADVAASYYMTANAGGQVSIGPGGFAPHPDYRLHVKATSLNGLLVESVGASYTLVGINTGGGNGVYGSGSGANSRGGQFWTDTGFCAASGDHTSSGNYGLLGTVNEGIFGNGAAGKNGVKGGTGSGTANAGVYGFSTATNGNGIIGEAHTGTAAYGVWGRATQGYGGVFSGGTYAIWAQGRAKVNTIEIVGGSDLAEPFDVASCDEHGDQAVEPGMVVVIDPANPGALRLSSAAYDYKVAGIISGANDLQPGMVMKSEGTSLADGAYPVALTGRVWCWCDATDEAIDAGDLLTTSDTPGHAMRASDRDRRAGAVIGKAMTPLAQGEKGLVLVLVNLQ